jgi:transaldolase
MTKGRGSDAAAAALSFEDAVVACGRPGSFPERPRLESHPGLRALREAGTAHVYADSASVEEIGELISCGENAVLEEVDGNTANQPLVRKALGEYLKDSDPARWIRSLRAHRRELPREELAPVLYAILCGRLGNAIVGSFAGQRIWEVSLQIHMSLSGDPERAVRIGHYLREMVGSAIVKVPFAPDEPSCFLVARDLEKAGVPVNFTSTFSARQAVAAALLANVTRTNVFLGRLNQGLGATLLGEQVTLEAQRALARLRRDHGLKTLLIAASMREPETFRLLAGCDVFTAPGKVLRGFLDGEGGAEELESRLETSYEDELEIGQEALDALSRDRIDRLHEVEPELVEFLVELRGRPDYATLRDGEVLRRRFEEAGFGDFFHSPSEAEAKSFRADKLPDLGSASARELALDTNYSLRANADFANQQDEIDAEMGKHLSW